MNDLIFDCNSRRDSRRMRVGQVEVGPRPEQAPRPAPPPRQKLRMNSPKRSFFLGGRRPWSNAICFGGIKKNYGWEASSGVGRVPGSMKIAWEVLRKLRL